MDRVELTKVWLTFISSLAWPAVTLAIAVLFRAQLRTILSRLRSGEIAGVKFSLVEAAEAISTKADALVKEPDAAQRGRLAQEIKVIASSLGAIGSEWFKYEVRFRGLPAQFGEAFIPRVAAGTPTAASFRHSITVPGEFTGTFFIRTLLSHNTLQRLAEESGLIFLDVANVVSAGTGRVPRDS
jgi:hypothetical protein